MIHFLLKMRLGFLICVFIIITFIFSGTKVERKSIYSSNSKAKAVTTTLQPCVKQERRPDDETVSVTAAKGMRRRRKNMRREKKRT